MEELDHEVPYKIIREVLRIIGAEDKVFLRVPHITTDPAGQQVRMITTNVVLRTCPLTMKEIMATLIIMAGVRKVSICWGLIIFG